MNIDKVLEFVAEFSEKFRGKNLKEFEKSKNYDLFPENDDTYGWRTGEWPNNGRYGVYLIMDKDENVIYIGESKNIGKRLSDYFKYADDKSCQIMHNNWSKAPKYVCSIAVPSETWFERLALEEFLIYNVKPIDNIKSK